MLSEGNHAGQPDRPWAMRATGLAIPLLAMVVLACQAPVPSDDLIPVRGVALAGPTCRVVTDPPDPACEDRPVAGAEIVVRDEAGESVASATAGADGSFVVSLPAGSYELVPQPVEGLMGTAAPVRITVLKGTEPAPVTISYDTGIR